MTRIPHLAVALDTSEWDVFDRWCGVFGGRAQVLKVGLEAFTRFGPRAVERAVDSGSDVFLDLKLHDIPNTVAGAVRAVGDRGARYLTLHAAGGEAMIEAARAAAPDELRLLAVTVLTHLDRAALGRLGIGEAPERCVTAWALLAREAGAHGVVCSPLEAKSVRATLGPDALIVTPGIRLPGADTPGGDDQRRVATPDRALEDGADLVVVGRPLTRAADPAAVLDELERALAGGAVH